MKTDFKRLDPEALALVATRFRVLGEPLRLRLLRELQDGECSISVLAQRVDTTQPNASKHLKLMMEAGLIARRTEGTTVYCSIADRSVFELCDLVCGSLRDQLQDQARLFGAVGAQRRRR